MRRQFKDTCLRLAEEDPKLLLIFGDIGVYLFRDFWAKYPERFLNAGICENTLVSMAAGLNESGFHPVVHTIAPFITERSYEQVKLDICYNAMPACLVSCGGSFDYAWDGATHHCYTDLELMRMLPGMVVVQPGSRKEFDSLFSFYYKKTSYIRISDDTHNLDVEVFPDKGVVIKHHDKANLTIITAGPILGSIMEACSDLPVNVLYFPVIKPLDTGLLSKYIHTKLLVIHDAFGLFEAITAAFPVRAEYHGIPDRFCCHYGKLSDIRRMLSLHPAGIADRIRKAL